MVSTGTPPCAKDPLTGVPIKTLQFALTNARVSSSTTLAMPPLIGGYSLVYVRIRIGGNLYAPIFYGKRILIHVVFCCGCRFRLLLFLDKLSWDSHESFEEKLCEFYK